MKKLIIILACVLLWGCAETIAILDVIYPPDPVCNAENAGSYWNGKVCMKDIGVGYYRWIELK